MSLCTDINVNACRATRATWQHNQVSSPQGTVRTSLLRGLRITRRVDILLFNPPYHPTEEAEVSYTGTAAAAWAGGKAGLQVTRPVIDGLADILSSCGVFYFVAVARNAPKSLIREITDTHPHMRADVKVERRAGREHLYVIRVVVNE